MVFAGGLQLHMCFLLDAMAWLGFGYSIHCQGFQSLVTFISTTLLFVAANGFTSRWPVTFPMLPLLALQLIRIIGRGKPLQNSKILYFLSLAVLLASLALSMLFPPLQLPQPQAGGPFSVGAVDFFLPIDFTKSQQGSGPATANADGTCSLFNHTHVRARLLYPTNSSKKTETMPYLYPSLAIEFLQESMKAAAPPELKAYDFLMHHWLIASVPAQLNAKLLPLSEMEDFPLVVYSHGLMGSADLYSYQAVSLASQGVLVLMLNHLDGSAPVADHLDGSRVKFDYEIVQLWLDGKKTEYVRERRLRTEWRAMELLGATDTIMALNNDDNISLLWKDAPHLSLKGRIRKDNVFFMGHSFGGATALAAAFRRPELLQRGGGVIAHEPVVDWLPDDVRRSLLPLDRLKGLESSHNFTGGTGGFELHVNETDAGDPAKPESPSIHDLNLLFLFSQQWRLLTWGESNILEEMHERGRLGPPGGFSDFAVIKEAFHNEFSDMCMLTPLWLARETGVTGPRNPLETAREIEERTWNFLSSSFQQN